MSGAAQFGAMLRLLRTDAGISLRALAVQIGVSSAYLNRVENGHDAVPTPDRIVRIAAILGVPQAVLLDLADRVAPLVSRYLEEVPAANALFLEIARRRLAPMQLARVKAFIQAEFATEERDRRARVPAPSSLLTEERVILRLSCTDIEDALDVVASRFSGLSWSAAQIAGELRRRERESPTAIGQGVAIPHALLPSERPHLALLTLAPPLPHQTPDGLPLRQLLVLVGGKGGRQHLELLTHLARLARAPEFLSLHSARSGRDVLARLRHIEAVYG